MVEEAKEDVCPKCGSSLGPIVETQSGKQLQRCSAGIWNKDTRRNEGCDFVKWIQMEPKELDEKCPDCGEPLVLFTTAVGKRMKKCSTAGWDKEIKSATGCKYIQWL
jgi:ssDNA-binding Zn-finger/Zn-ribbon topoisomerase 1